MVQSSISNMILTTVIDIMGNRWKVLVKNTDLVTAASRPSPGTGDQTKSVVHVREHVLKHLKFCNVA